MTDPFRSRALVTRLFLTLLLAAAASARAADAPPDPALPKAPGNWKVELIAKAPQIQHPSVVCCAPDGRIFVGEDPIDMHLPSSAAADRVLCFHPDGKVTVFAEKLHAVYGLAYLDGKVYIHHTPKFSVFTDDGSGVGKDRVDLIASTNPNPWNTGGFNDHIPSNFKLGMDGYFYLSTGDKGIYGAVGTDGSRAELRGGGVIRFRPDGTGLEVFSTGTRSHLDVSMNAEDEMFTYDNTDDGRGWWTRFTHMVDGGFYGYPWDYWPDDATPAKVEDQIKSGKPGQPYTLWRMAEYGGGSPCGAVGYNEDALPAEYRGNLFHCEWGKGHVARFVVERAGGTYRVASNEQFMTPGGEFRPLGITVTPDGLGFVVTDWNLGGWKQPSEGGKRGRLFRVTWTGKSEAAPRPGWLVAAATGKPFAASRPELIEALKHPAQSVRMVAQRRIAERGSDAVAPLVALLKDTTAPPHARWHAVWALDGIDGGKAARQAIAAVVQDANADPSVRRQAARQLGTRRAREASGALLAAASDRDASVRFHAATALGRVGDASTVPALLARAGEDDFFTQYALFTALNRIGRADPAAWSQIVRALQSSDLTVRGRATFAMRDAYDTALVNALAGYINDTSNDTNARAAALAALAPLHRKEKPWDGDWWGTQPVLAPRPKKEVEWEGTPAVVAAVRAGLKDTAPAVRLAAVKGLQAAPDPAAGDELAAMFEGEADAGVRVEVLKAVAASKPEAAASFVGTILRDPKADPALVPDAVRIAQRVGGPDMLEALARAAASDAPPGVIVQVLDALSRVKGGTAVAVASKLVADRGKPAEVRRAAAAALAASRSADAVPALLRAFGDEAIRREAIVALAAIPDARALDAYLEGLDSKDGTVRQRCRDALKSIAGQALPLVEARLDKAPFSTQVMGELQNVFTAHQPIREWRVLWPWPSDAGDPFPPQALDSPAPGTIKAPDGRELRWRTVRGRGPDGMVDLGSDSRSEAYAFAEIKSDAGRAVQFRVGSDDRMTLYLNGRLIHEDLADGGWAPDEATISAELKPGRNVLVAKVGNTGGGWMFSVAVSGEPKGKLFEYNAKSLDPAAFARFAETHPGDAANGKQLFSAAAGVACVKCHQAPGVAGGGEVGPSLAGVGAKYDRAKLIESVLYPSKQIFDGYEQTLVRTKDGTTHAGGVRGETQDELTLIDSENRKTVIRKADIERRKVSEVSLMPDGLQTALKAQEFADLIAYLESLKEPPAPAKK
jgi:putative membrane-bound dehydrogenase-like protein